ncbi:MULTISPECIES: phage tail protein [Kosakonia]|uniref:Phage tail protein n=1 Tax=Kosakonia quasisacchari TaxID=2529380 RepID=A0A4R0GJW0_9ENTR|nr:phage tail protein [Kosakonia quasisacchari]TCB97750.1 phage tail protein [Kosakonia quasisacchari]
MMLALGLFVFMRQTLPFQNMDRTSAFNWKNNARVGKRAAFQYLGPGEETIDITGALYPELTGGVLSLAAVRLMADQGRSWPLIDGTGMIYGMYVISSVIEKGSEFYSDGSPRKINFTLKLTRVDESLVALAGDLQEQGEHLLRSATNMLGNL